jgi:fimbrial chaperone protein
LNIEQEQTYRVLLGEVPSEINPNRGVGLNLTVNLPIFVRPDSAKAIPVWTIAEKTDQGPTLTLINEGDAHVKLTEIAIVSADGNTATPLPRSSSYVFAGEKRTWPLEIALAAIKGSVTVRAETNIGPIEKVVPLPDS